MSSNFITFATTVTVVVAFLIVGSFQLENESNKLKVKLGIRVHDDDQITINIGVSKNPNGKVTLLDALKVAAEKNERFKFEGIQYPFGFYITSIDSISVD